MTRYNRVIEPFFGSGTMYLHAMGAETNIAPYQGGKWRYRHDVFKITEIDGAENTPWIAGDAGPWGMAWGAIAEFGGDALADEIDRVVGGRDPRVTYRSLHGHDVPNDLLRRAAEFFVLQLWSFGGKAVSDSNGRWASPGFARRWAYGTFDGKTKPRTPRMVSVIRSLGRVNMLDVRRAYASNLVADVTPGAGDLLILDPVYAGTTGYGTDEDVDAVDIAIRASMGGASVLLHEGSRIERLELRGFQAIELRKRSAGNLNAHGTQDRSEWAHWKPGEK